MPGDMFDLTSAYLENDTSVDEKSIKEVSKKFLDVPSQTLMHGDFHNGNHMYLEQNGELKVVAFDFQAVGQ